MPISTSSFGDDRDSWYKEYAARENFEQETIEVAGMTPEVAETCLKRLGGGVEEKLRRVEGIGWAAEILPTESGVAVAFFAHDELLDDLIRRFEEWADRELS
ncbi:MAG: hypothetical protein H3C34_20460 [Caldilineaceae bacterium]|nr:hypothetical protein [Caldilineaceae bacterium]